MNSLKQYVEDIKIFDNTKNLELSEYKYQDTLSLKSFQKAFNEITSWDEYKVTPLKELNELANKTGVSKIYYKDESHRFKLKSFKALGGAYAVANLLIIELKEKGIIANSSDLLAGTYKEHTKKITVTCATDGNHGKSVAWGASIFGCNCEIFIHANVSDKREEEIAKYGANITRINGNYDDAVHLADVNANKHKFLTVSDTSYEGYTEVPKDVMQGYTVMVDEAINQMTEKPSHVFLQGGVGGVAAAVVSFFHETYGKDAPIFVIIEPTNAACLLESAKNGKPTVIHGNLETIMAGLSCGEVSMLAWPILKNITTAFFSIPDEPIKDVMRYLSTLSEPIIAGESAVAGLTGYLIAQEKEEYRKILNLNKDSKILFFGTEGDTDEVIYKQIVGKSSQEILNKGKYI
jgi:diaminopropionate ammonia-lyase